MSEFNTRSALISDIRTTLKEHNVDSNLNDRQIWMKIRKHTNWILSRESGKMKVMKSNNIFQTYKCVEVIDAPTIDDCCGIRGKCFIRRTKEKLPELFEAEDGVIIKSVFTIDGSKEFSPIRITEYMRKLENPDHKYDKSLYYFYNNGYLYFPQNTTIKMVMVKGLFIDDVVSPCDEDEVKICKPSYEMFFRFPKRVEAEIISNVYKEFGIFKQLIADEDINKNENRKN